MIQAKMNQNRHLLFQKGMHTLKSAKTARDVTKAKKLLLSSEKLGFAEAMFQSGLQCLREQDTVQAAEWLKKAAEMNHVSAMRVFADRWLLKKYKKNSEEESKAKPKRKRTRNRKDKFAKHLLIRAAQQGSIPAMEDLASYLCSKSSAKNKLEGKQWLQRAEIVKGDRLLKKYADNDEQKLRSLAETGHLYAMLLYGKKLLKKMPTGKHQAEGIDWIQKAAEKGSV
jgi:TPR repeat protein